MGRAVGHPWSVIFADYNLPAGRLWPLVLITLGIAPVLFARFAPR